MDGIFYEASGDVIVIFLGRLQVRANRRVRKVSGNRRMFDVHDNSGKKSYNLAVKNASVNCFLNFLKVFSKYF